MSALLAVALALAAAVASPPPARPAGVDEHVGERVPLDLRFTSAEGRELALGELVRGDRPVLLVLAYARCELLCSVVLHGVSEAAARLERELGIIPGRDYAMVFVSIDPGETPATAARKQRALLERMGHPDEPWRWSFLVAGAGGEASVRALADALGFRYAWDERTQQYAHPAVIFVLTPDGRIARYVYGVQYGPTGLAEALRQAASGATSPSLASAVLECFRFDPAARRYGARIQRYFRIGAATIFTALASLVLGLFVWERRRRA